MRDPTLDQLVGLTPETAAYATELLNYVRSFGYPLIIGPSGGRRQLAEQRELLRAGRTRTLDSAHLRGEAFDVDLQGYGRDDVPRWFWQAVGEYGDRGLGLVWGGRWGWDFGHFELPKSAPGRTAG